MPVPSVGIFQFLKGNVLGISTSLYGMVKKLINKYTFTAFLLFLTFFGGIQLAWEQKNPLPLITEVGLDIINGDGALDREVTKLENSEKPIMEKFEDGFFRIIGGFFSYLWAWIKIIGIIASKVWLIYMFFLIVFKIWSKSLLSDESNTGKNFIFTFVTVMVIWIVTSSLVLTVGMWDGDITLDTPEEDGFYSKTKIIFSEIVHFRGVLNLGQYLVTRIPAVNDAFIRYGLKDATNA